MIAAANTQHREGIGQHLDLVRLLDDDLRPAHVTVRGDDPQIESRNGKTGDDPEKAAEFEALLPGAVGNLKTAGVDKKAFGFIAELAQFARKTGWSFGTDRLGHGECSLLEILINANGIVDIVEDFQGAVAQQDPHVALLAQVFHVVGYHDKARCLALLIERIHAFLLEAGIPY